MKKFVCAIALTLTATFATQAEEKIEVVLDGLHNPSGLAVQPNTGHIFVSDSGAGKIVRIVDGKSEDVVTDFPKDVYGKGPKYDIGPLGLAFIDEDTLVVGGGGKPDTEELVRVYTVPKAGEEAIKADNMKASLGPLESSDELAAEGNYYAVAVTKNAIYATANGDDTKGWVVRAEINGDGSFGELERYIATKEATGVDAPVGITTSPEGHVVVGQMGEITVPKDGLLTFYNGKDGKMLLNLETGLNDITAVIYSPKGHLYALDFAWLDNDANKEKREELEAKLKEAEEGSDEAKDIEKQLGEVQPVEEAGLYRLDAEGKGKDQVVEPKLITKLKKPAAIAFGDDGAMYIAVFGDTDGDAEESAQEEKPTGQVIKLEPGL